MKTDHIRIKLTAGHIVFTCEHCGNNYNLPVPCPIEFPAAIGKIWTRLHKGCKTK